MDSCSIQASQGGALPLYSPPNPSCCTIVLAIVMPLGLAAAALSAENCRPGGLAHNAGLGICPGPWGLWAMGDRGAGAAGVDLCWAGVGGAAAAPGRAEGTWRPATIRRWLITSMGTRMDWVTREALAPAV